MIEQHAAAKSPNITKAIDILCGWAIENDVNLDINFCQDYTAGIIGKNAIFDDVTIPYMIVVRVTYKEHVQRMIFNPDALELYDYGDNIDVLYDSFMLMVEKVKNPKKKGKKK